MNGVESLQGVGLRAMGSWGHYLGAMAKTNGEPYPSMDVFTVRAESHRREHCDWCDHHARCAGHPAGSCAVAMRREFKVWFRTGYDGYQAPLTR